MTRFEQDGFYNGIPYRVLPDCSIEAKTPNGIVKFKNMDELVASCGSSFVNTHGLLPTINELNLNVPSAKSVDYYTILIDAINAAQQNSAQLRALVYERARFNLKREILFGYSLVGLADVARRIQDFELAVARIEANAVDHLPAPTYRESQPRKHVEISGADNAVQILPPKPDPPLYAGLIRRTENWQHSRVFEEFIRYVRFTKKFIVAGAVGMAAIAVAVTMTLWLSRNSPSKVEVASKLPRENVISRSSPLEGSAAQADDSSKVQFPLPSSFGIYVLTDNKLTELEQLPIAVPDARIALSAEIAKPSQISISDKKPAFILFRRDLLNAAPQKIMLRVVARMARDTKIVEGKARTS